MLGKKKTNKHFQQNSTFIIKHMKTEVLEKVNLKLIDAGKKLGELDDKRWAKKREPAVNIL